MTLRVSGRHVVARTGCCTASTMRYTKSPFYGSIIAGMLTVQADRGRLSGGRPARRARRPPDGRRVTSVTTPSAGNTSIISTTRATVSGER